MALKVCNPFDPYPKLLILLFDSNLVAHEYSYM